MAKKKDELNGQLRLRDLYAACRLQMEKGNGDKVLVVSDDNEGNGYHGMFFAISPCEPDTARLIYDSNENRPSNILIVG